MATENNSSNFYIGQDSTSSPILGLNSTPNSDIISPPSLLKFNFTYGSGTPEATIAAVEAAASHWASQFTDDITLNIYVDFGDLPDTILGGARPNMVEVKYRDVLTGMALDQTSQDDAVAFASMEFDYKDSDRLQLYEQGALGKDEIEFSDSSSFSMLIDGSFANGAEAGGTYLDNNGNQNNETVWMTSANAKALGLMDADDPAFDAWLRFNDLSYLWDFDAKDGIQPDQYDFSTVVRHELGHALGFISGSDVQSILMMAGDNASTIDEKDLAHVSMLDLFRYSEESAAQSVVKQYQTVDSSLIPEMVIQGVNDWTLGRVDAEGKPVDYYFSLDRGQTKIASLAKGTTGTGADDYQASHWASEDIPLGVMTPNLKTGQSIDIGELDLRMLDILGFDRRDAADTNPHAGSLDLNQTFGSSGNALEKAVSDAMQDLKMDRDLLSNWMGEQRQIIVNQGVAERNHLAQERSDLAQWHSDGVAGLQRKMADDLAALEVGQSAEQRQIAAQLRQLETNRATQETQIWKQLESSLASLETKQTEGQRQIAQAMRQIDVAKTASKASILQTLRDDLAALDNNYLTGLQLSWEDKQDLAETLQKQAHEQISALTNQAESNRKSLEGQLSKSWVDQIKTLQEKAANQVAELSKKVENEKLGLEKKLSKDWKDKIKHIQYRASEALADLDKSLEKKIEVLDDREKDLSDWSVNLNKVLDDQLESQIKTLEKLEEAQNKRIDKLANETDEERARREFKEAKTLANLQEKQSQELLKIAEKQLEELARLSDQAGFDSPLSRSRSGSTTSDARYWLSRSRSGSTTQSSSYWQSAFIPK
ncbi:MAG: hypothetical protein DCF32_10450 [Leptolyngbya sp.]|nr:MAG: hypothetical protein DCF32_10450 [Leptolyngbya sp.]